MRYANEELKLDREKIRDGFKIRLIPLSNNFVIGRAMWFRLEMKNISNETLGYMHTSMMVNDPMIVKDPNGVRLPYIDRSYQTAVGREFVEPGETVLLADNYDVRSQYHIARPGSYTFQFRGTELLGIKPSNVVEARIKPGLLSPLEIVAEKLIPVLPQGWELTRTALPLEQFVEANTGEVIMVHLIGKRSGKGSGTSVFMAIFLGADYTKLELQGYLAELEFWGDCPWGPVYGKSTDAESLWPNYKEQIVNTLNIQMPNKKPAVGGEAVNNVRAGLQTGGPYVLYHVTSGISLHVENKSTQKMLLLYPPRFSNEGGGRWQGLGKIEIVDSAGKTVAPKFNVPKSYEHPINPNGGYTGPADLDIYGFDFPGPGKYKVRVTLGVQPGENGKTFKVSTDWLEFDAVLTDHVPGTPYTAAQAFEEAQACSAMLLPPGMIDRDQAIEKFLAVARDHRDTQYELKAYKWASVIAGQRGPYKDDQTRAKYREQAKVYRRKIIERWPDLVLPETVSARHNLAATDKNQFERLLDFYQWLTSRTREQRIAGATKWDDYFRAGQTLEQKLAQLDRSLAGDLDILQRNLVTSSKTSDRLKTIIERFGNTDLAEFARKELAKRGELPSDPPGPVAAVSLKNREPEPPAKEVNPPAIPKHPAAVASKSEAGPVDIRLLGLRPQLGDAIYDITGKKIRETLGVGRPEGPHWGDAHRCDYIFELPHTREPLIFLPIPKISVSGENRILGGSMGYCFLPGPDKNLLWVRSSFPRSYKKSILAGLRTIDIPVKAIDLSIRYFHGPPREADLTFKGPFKAGRKLTDKTGKYEITFGPERRPGGSRYRRFELNTKQRLDIDIPVLLYYTAGNRILAHNGSASSGQNGTHIEYDIYGLVFENIAMITFGEKPFEKTFTNLKPNLPGQSPRNYAEYLDTIAERLNLNLPPEKLADYTFTNADEALKVVDVVRGRGIVKNTMALLYGGSDRNTRLDPTKLNFSQAKNLRSTALRWTGALDPEIRACGVKIGLRCKWPEFVEPALVLLNARTADNPYSRPTGKSDAAHALAGYAEHLTDSNIVRIGQALSRQTNPNIISDLKRCLIPNKSPPRIKALRDLAAHEGPWLWWDAIERLSSWSDFEGRHDSLPGDLKVRLFLVRGPHGFSNPEQIASPAHSLLAGLLTPQLRDHDLGTFYDVLRSIDKNLDRPDATAAMIAFLRRANVYDNSTAPAIDKVVKYVNLRHNQNIGKLGTDITQQTPNLENHPWPAIAAEAIKWYETRNTPDPDSSASQEDR